MFAEVRLKEISTVWSKQLKIFRIGSHPCLSYGCPKCWKT